MEALEWLIGSALTEDNPEHALTRLLGPQHVLIDAPAGCGKTQALAERARALVSGRAVVAPRQILAVTYSNKATDNLRSRLRSVMGSRYWERVAVSNFHGIARRLILAHGVSVDVPREASMPTVGWRKAAFAGAGIGWDISTRVNESLREAKSQPRTNTEVMAKLCEIGDAEAMAFEEMLQEQNQLDFDDLLRHAERILSIAAIARLYRERFPIVMVDELQDLTPQQFRIVLSLCGTALTGAGDRAQGIFSFAGAEPDTVYEELKLLAPAKVVFRQSYRSAPRVLDAVNAIAQLHGASELTPAEPDSWADKGRVISIVSDNAATEAADLVPWLARLMEMDPVPSVGVIVRATPRDSALRDALEGADIDIEVWADATHNPRIVRLLKRYAPLAEKESELVADQLTALRQFCREEVPPEEIELQDELASALSTFEQWAEEGLNLSECVSRCRSARPNDAPVAPGVHLLSAHRGKGQQFDWVVVLGLEERQLPHWLSLDEPGLSEELRVLHVIVSRARHGIVITRVESSKDRYGRTWPVEPSRWWGAIEATVTDGVDVIEHLVATSGQ